MDRSQMKKQAKALLKPQFGTVLLTLIVSSMVVGALNLIPVAGTVAYALLAGPLSVGAMLIYTTVTAGKKAQLEQLFAPFRVNFVSSFLAHLLQMLFICLWSLLLVIPGILKAYSYSMTYYVLRREPETSAMDAIKRSEELMRGHRWELFVLQLSFIGWYLLCIVTFGLASIWVGPYTEITKTLFFDNIYGIPAGQLQMN